MYILFSSHIAELEIISFPSSGGTNKWFWCLISLLVRKLNSLLKLINQDTRNPLNQQMWQLINNQLNKLYLLYISQEWLIQPHSFSVCPLLCRMVENCSFTPFKIFSGWITDSFTHHLIQVLLPPNKKKHLIKPKSITNWASVCQVNVNKKHKTLLQCSGIFLMSVRVL